MTTIIAAACLTACSETDNNPVNPDSHQTIKAPDTTEPTTDQMAVRIDADMPAAVLSSFDDKSDRIHRERSGQGVQLAEAHLGGTRQEPVHQEIHHPLDQRLARTKPRCL